MATIQRQQTTSGGSVTGSLNALLGGSIDIVVSRKTMSVCQKVAKP
jgi:hypothetical protein